MVEGLCSLKLKATAKKVENNLEEPLIYCDLPSEHWTRFRTNNIFERLNREIRRYTRVVGSFPDGNSALILDCAWLRHVACTQWSSKKYMNEAAPVGDPQGHLHCWLTSFIRSLQTNLSKTLDTTFSHK